MADTIQPRTQPDQPRAPAAHAPSAHLDLTDDSAPTSVDDSGLGLMLFVVFVSAVLLISGAVAFLSMFAAWWVLGLVFGIDLLVTGVVGTVVFTVLGDGNLRPKAKARLPLEPATNRNERGRTSDRSAPVHA